MYNWSPRREERMVSIFQKLNKDFHFAGQSIKSLQANISTAISIKNNMKKDSVLDSFYCYKNYQGSFVVKRKPGPCVTYSACRWTSN